jgi:hypothetical protein
VVENANSSTIGSPIRAQNTIVRRRPNRSETPPKVIPPIIAPML